jgi:phenylacetate-CoA ligase
MEPFIKPSDVTFLLRVAANYLSDLDRFKYLSLERIKKYRDKKFRELVKYAYTIPLYKQKFKELGVTPGDISGVKDIVKLPVISRDDVISSFPDGIITPAEKKKSALVNTSGSTRNPVQLYVDQFMLIKALHAYVRELRQYNIKWSKDRITIIANFYSQTGPTQLFASGASPTLKPVQMIFPLDNIQQINSDDDLVDIAKKVDSFKPDCIVGFPGPLRHLALLYNKGYCQNLHPKCIVSTGGVIDKYQKKLISETFNIRVYDIFGSTEMGPIAFECEEGNFHINSDFVYLETINNNGETIEKGKPGILAITRLYGRGTPLIRYTGMEDIIMLKDGTCGCGRNTEIMNAVPGRIKECIVLPDHRILYARNFLDTVGFVMQKMKTDKIHMIQLVQEKLDKIELRVIIDEAKRDLPPKTDVFLDELRKEFQKLLGSEVDVSVKDTKKFKHEPDRPDSTPGILSNIDVRKYL